MLGAVKKLLQHQQSSKSIVDAKLHIHEIYRWENLALNYDEGDKITILKGERVVIIYGNDIRLMLYEE